MLRADMVAVYVHGAITMEAVYQAPGRVDRNLVMVTPSR